MGEVPAGPDVPGGNPRPVLAIETVNGLTVIHPATPQDGDVTAALTFRVGVADEPLAMRGICHLIEHLCLSLFQSSRLQWNGTVDLSRTTFLARGSAEEVTRFLGEVSRALGSLPATRVSHERRVLQVEAQSRTDSIFDVLSVRRYGIRGPGLTIVPEWGLEWLEAPELQRWVAEWFTASNAALWSTVPLSVTDLDLPTGTRRPPTVPEPIYSAPVAEAHDTPLIGLQSEVPRALTSSIATYLAGRHLLQRLRHEHGLSYTPSAGYSPLTASAALVALSAETHAEHRGDTVAQFLDALEELADRGPSEEDLTAARMAASDSWSQPDAALAHMDAVALGILFGMEDPLYERHAEHMARLTRESVATAVRAMLDAAFLVVPAGCESAVSRRYHAFRVPDIPPVKGATARFRYAPIGDQFRLTYGPDGVTHWNADGQPTTIRFDACAGVVAWRDGSRLLCGHDGTTLELRSDAWKRYDAVRACIDAHAPQPMAQVDKVPATDPDWVRQANRWRLKRVWTRWGKGIVVAGGVLWLAGLVAVFDPAGFGVYSIMVVAGSFLWGMYQATRRS